MSLACIKHPMSLRLTLLLSVLFSIVGCSEGVQKLNSSASPSNAISFPKDDAVENVDINEKFELSLPRQVLPSSVDNSSIEIKDSNGLIDGMIELDTSGYTLIFYPTKKLSLLTEYSVALSTTVVDINKQTFNVGSYSFTTRDGSWVTSEVKSVANLEPSNGFSPTVGMQTKIDDTGNIVVAWVDWNTFTLWSNRFDNSLPTPAWGTPTKMQSTESFVYAQSLEMDNEGNTYLLWAEKESVNNTTILWSKRYQVSGSTPGWSNAEIVSESLASNLYFRHELAFNAAGNGIMLWIEVNNNQYEIWAKYYKKTSNQWGKSEKIDSCALPAYPGNIDYMDLTIDDVGNGFAIWGGDSLICTNEYKVTIANPAWSRAKILTQETNILHGFKKNEGGDIVALWRDPTVPFVACIGSCQFDPLNRFVAGHFYPDVNSYFMQGTVTSPDLYGQIDNLLSDNLDNGYVLVHKRFSAPPAGPGPISYVPVNTDFRGMVIGSEIGMPADNPSTNSMLAIDSKNNGVMTWVNKYADELSNVGTQKIWVNRLSIVNGTPTWDQPIEIFTLYGATETIGLEKPQISLNSFGQGVAVWNDAEKIYANRFE